MDTDLPAHLTVSGSLRTLCNLGANNPRRFPLVDVSFLPAHHDGYGLTACPDCALAWSRTLLAALYGS